MIGSNRKAKNILILPRMQLRISLYFIVSGLFFLCLIVGMIYNKIRELGSLMNTHPVMDFATQNLVNSLMFDIVQISLGGFLSYLLFSFFFAIVVSHRIAGPVIAINAYIREIQDGNYDYQRKLRPRDELNEIMDELHKLPDILRAREA